MKEYKKDCPKISLVKEKSYIKSVHLASANDCAEFGRNFYETDIEMYESMFMVLLNQSNNTIGWVVISQGGVSGTVADPRIIAKYAVESLASSVVANMNLTCAGGSSSVFSKALNASGVNWCASSMM